MAKKTSIVEDLKNSFSNLNAIERAVIGMISSKKVFYACLLSQMVRIEDEKVVTAGVSVQK